MMKNYYLSRTEQELMSILKSAEIVTIQEVENLFPRLSKDMIKKVLSSLVKKGYLYRLKRGLYLVNEEPGKPLIKNPYKIALMLFPGYVAFSSALRLYGLIEYEAFTIFVATPRKSGEKEIGEYTIKAVALGEKAVGIIIKNGVYTSTLAKTFFDCFYKPSYCGGYSEVTKALYEAEKIDWDEFLSYFKRFASNSLCQRTGYILELVKDIGVDVPEDVIEYLRSRVKTWTKLVPTFPSRGKSVREWKLIDNLGEEKILGWAYG
ncbi:type IV toxin-antitoxin system AbiEi family antitoxin [Thermococcus sp. SY098]|uniref:type IV toxin-antitoxin system AbiEi family antitoxin domain-containing protein n=1 Tax=Thermococcus sp. SY098 TaxID=3111325 RepID=UPI002D784B9D|nr:type IV toxin-antitoxin system AbiEi family antitoxin [Thermococcus sp. SY098]WRS52134.1 type IV toxin-antitoxin system AbiEi family antitoxin [Thermococcus sp. SY098]